MKNHQKLLIPIGRIKQVLRGKATPFAHPDGKSFVPSAIDKQPIPDSASVRVTRLGLEGDEQGDTKIHGGADKAVHQYALEHYELWRKELDSNSKYSKYSKFCVGGFGENLSSSGMTESNLCFGDRVQIGSVVLELSQTRQPCWKLNVRFSQKDMARRVQSTGRTGWYWRVLQEGSLQAGDEVYLLERPNPDWPLSRVLEVLYHRRLDSPEDHQELEAFARLHPALPPSWQRMVKNRLERQQIENWEARLYGGGSH